MHEFCEDDVSELYEIYWSYRPELFIAEGMEPPSPIQSDEEQTQN